MVQQFVLRFMINSIISSALLLFIHFMNKKLFHTIGVKAQYYAGVFSFGLFFIPFIPNQFFLYGTFLKMPWSMNSLPDSLASKARDLYSGVGSLIANNGWMKDYSQSVNSSISDSVNYIIFAVWMLGMIVTAVISIRNNRNIKYIKSSMTKISNEEILELYSECKQRVNVKQNIILGESPFIQSPMVTGLFKVCIILPFGCTNNLSKQEIGYILMHELIHVKKKDIWITYAMFLIRILYWFHPIVYYFLKETDNNRELACDASVLSILNESGIIEYGKTIIHFAEVSKGSFYVTANMGGSTNQIKKRIMMIACYTKETSKTRILGKLLIFAICILIFIQAPISAVAFTGVKYDFQGKNVVYEDLSDYFNGMDGCFVLYDLQADQYTIYNEEKSITRVSPDSTYKIYSALIALENGIIDGSGVQYQSSDIYPYPEWNRTQTLSSAMKYSVSWYFQNLDRAVGKKTLQDYFQSLDYGNADLSGGINDYWLESSLLISPLEQVELLRKFYTDTLAFKSENIDIVKDTLILDKKEGIVLSGKTGTGTINYKDVNGWFIGYVDKKEDTLIFAVNISGADSAGGSTAAHIALAILEDKNIY